MHAWLAQQQPGVQFTCVGCCWLQCFSIMARCCLWVLHCPRVSGRAELPGAMGRCCWLPAAGSALLELRLQLQLGAEQAASCLRRGLGSFEKERPMEQVQSHSCFVCWCCGRTSWGADQAQTVFASNKAQDGRLPRQGPIGLKVPKAGERHSAL